MAPAFSSFSVVSNDHNFTYILRENKWAMLTKVLSSWRSHTADLQPPNLWLYNQTTPETSKSSNQSSPQTSKPPNKSTHRPLSHPIRAPTHLQTTQSDSQTPNHPTRLAVVGASVPVSSFLLAFKMALVSHQSGHKKTMVREPNWTIMLFKKCY